MPLTNLSELLLQARQRNYCIAAFDVVNAEYAQAIVGAAEQEKSPLVLMIYEAYLRYIDLELMVPSLLRLANRSHVPVAVHLDHGTSWEMVVKAVKHGCTSVMLDSSEDPFELNVARTCEVVRLCKPLGASVESELGFVGGDESIARTELASGTAADTRCFTDPDESARFVEDTGVDALAISCGNIHGPYKGVPCLDLERITQIADVTSLPLVLHGGSGLSDDDFRSAIQRGICKINVNTALIAAAGASLKSSFQQTPDALNFPELLLSSYEAVFAESARLMNVFGCAGKA